MACSPGLREGMSSLIDALVRSLPEGSVRCGVKVERLDRGRDGRWRIACSPGRPFLHVRGRRRDRGHAGQCRGPLAGGVDGALAASLERISSTSCAIVSLAYRRDQVAHALDGFGFVVPRIENRNILSGSFSSVKFPGRCPEGTVLLRAFLGGAFRPDVLDQGDGTERAGDGSVDPARHPGRAVVRHVSRWPQVMPQYELGHLELVQSSSPRRPASRPGPRRQRLPRRRRAPVHPERRAGRGTDCPRAWGPDRGTSSRPASRACESPGQLSQGAHGPAPGVPGRGLAGRMCWIRSRSCTERARNREVGRPLLGIKGEPMSGTSTVFPQGDAAVQAGASGHGAVDVESAMAAAKRSLWRVRRQRLSWSRRARVHPERRAGQPDTDRPRASVRIAERHSQ